MDRALERSYGEDLVELFGSSEGRCIDEVVVERLIRRVIFDPPPGLTTARVARVLASYAAAHKRAEAQIKKLDRARELCLVFLGDLREDGPLSIAERAETLAGLVRDLSTWVSCKHCGAFDFDHDASHPFEA